MSQGLYVAIFCIAVSVLVISVHVIVRGRSTVHWSTADAEVLASDLEEDLEGYPYHFTYKYRVRGEEFISNSIGDFRTMAEKRAVILRNPKGSRVEVRYRAEFPGDSLVIVGPPKVAMFVAMTSGIFLAGWVLGIGWVL